MATVYEVKIEVVSPWCSFDEATIKKAVEEALDNLQVDEDNKLEVVQTEVNRTG